MFSPREAPKQRETLSNSKLLQLPLSSTSGSVTKLIIVRKMFADVETNGKLQNEKVPKEFQSLQSKSTKSTE